MSCFRWHRIFFLSLRESRRLGSLRHRSTEPASAEKKATHDEVVNLGVTLSGQCSRSPAGVNTPTPDEAIYRRSTVKAANLDWRFEDGQLAYKSKKTSDILRAVFVLKCCSLNFFVENNIQLMKLGERILGNKLFSSLMRSSFFGHFVGGEDKSSLQRTVEINAQFGVKSILHYLFEQNTDKEGAGKEVGVENIKPSVPGAEFWDLSWENNKKCIEAVAEVTKCQGVAAVKLTGLARPEVMEKSSDLLKSLSHWFRGLPNVEVTSERAWHMDLVSSQTIVDHLTRANVASDTVKLWIDKLDTNKDGYLDEGDLACLLENRLHFSDLLYCAGLIDVTLTTEERSYILQFDKTLTALIQYAIDLGVTVVIDAEQTWFQPIIDAIALDLMRKFNKEATNVHTTAQCYLKDSVERAQLQLDLSEREGFCLGYRMVRGAYMAQEHQRSAETGEATLQPSYEATCAAYDHIVSLVLQQMTSRYHGRLAACIATHNEDAIRSALKKITELGIEPSDPMISFAQLNGMCDYMSFPLGQAGYNVFKSIPYGPIKETLPYLSRRANENRSIFDKVKKERVLLGQEFGRRVTSGQLFYKPKI